jgi:hypothetical protein
VAAGHAEHRREGQAGAPHHPRHSKWPGPAAGC